MKANNAFVDVNANKHLFPKIFCKSLVWLTDKLNMGFLSVPNVVPYLIFNVNILVVRAWIVTN